jgi:multidrug efflux pump subunit AcrA (membrane-fusion protein)
MPGSDSSDAPDDASGDGGTIQQQDLSDLEAYAEKRRQDDAKDELLERSPPGVQRGGIYLIGAAVVLALVLLGVGHVNQTVTASGQLVAGERGRMVRAPIAGTVTEVAASAGARLQQGDPVLYLSAPAGGTAEEDSAALERRLREERRRLEALRSDSALVARLLSAPDSARGTGRTVPATDTAFEAVRALRLAWMDLQATREGEASPAESIERVQARLDSLQARHDAVRARLRQGEATPEGTTQRLEERTAMLGLELETQRLRLAALRRAHDERRWSTRKQRAAAQMDYRRSVEGLRDVARTLDRRLRAQAAAVGETEARLQRRTRSDTGRIAATAPGAGTVGTISAATGTSVEADEAVAEIVPTGAPLVAEASVSGAEVGDVEEGQSVTLRVAAYPHRQFGTVEGRVHTIRPDPEGNAFLVSIELRDKHLATETDTVALHPGLSVQADIIAGTERLIWMLFR